MPGKRIHNRNLNPRRRSGKELLPHRNLPTRPSRLSSISCPCFGYLGT